MMKKIQIVGCCGLLLLAFSSYSMADKVEKID